MHPDPDRLLTFREFEEKLDAKLEAFRRELAGEIARAVNVFVEHTRDMFRLATDQTRAVSDRLDDHVADATVHRARRKAR